MGTTYTITDENFETVAKGVTLKQAAAIVGAFPSTLESCFARYEVACIGRYVVEPVATYRKVRRFKPLFAS